MSAVLRSLVPNWADQVSAATLRADFGAGLLGTLLTLPQGIAFATLAGLPPVYGLYSAVVPCAVAALFGSSWHVMSGPTNANSLALLAMLSPLAAAASPEYIELALLVTILVGVMQWLVGFLRLGVLANFISPSTLVGFTGGAALLIGVHALKDLLALPLPAGTPAGEVLVAAFRDAPSPGTLIVGMTTLVVAAGLRLWVRRSPFMLVGMAAGTLVAWLINHRSELAGLGPVPVLGPLPSPWPPFGVPKIEWGALQDLIGIAGTLTIVALGQSIAIAKAIAARSGQRIDANREFIGQGLSNIVGGFFSCYVSCGSLNRSVPNLEAGARTPLASVFSSILLLVLAALSASLLALIPFAATAGLLLLVAWLLLDLPLWRRLALVNRTEFGIAAGTLLATVSIRLDVAILAGTVASLMSYLYRTSRPAVRTLGFESTEPERRLTVIDGRPDALPECPQLKLLRVEGSVYFGAEQHVSDRLHALRATRPLQPHLLVMSRSMNFIDQSGAALWETELASRRKAGGDLYFHRPRTAVLEMWKRTGFLGRLGEDHIFPDKRSAISHIFGRLDRAVCARCEARVFTECASLAPPGTGRGRDAA